MVAVGYAQAVITPVLEQTVYLAGFGRNRRAASVHDDLYARALAVVAGEQRVVVVAVDVIGLTRRVCQASEQRVAQQWPGVRLLIAATHTHHGPDTLGLWGPDDFTRGVDAAYMAQLGETIAATAAQALAEARPAWLAAASVQALGVAKNARSPQVLDQELTCLQFRTDEGARTLATLIVFPCHPEVLWDENPHITSDYLYTLRAALEHSTGAPVLALVGALGGMMTPDMGGNTFAHAAAMGHILAGFAEGALAGAAARPIRELEYRRCVYQVPFANPVFRLALEAGLLEADLDEAGTLTTEASLLRLDDCWLLGVPGELLPGQGLAYKARLAAQGARLAAVIGLANDELGYILPADEFIYPDDPFNPGDHYEESMSTGADAEPLLTAAVERLLTDATHPPQPV